MVKGMAKGGSSKSTKPERLSITLTPGQTAKLNRYIIKTGEHQGRIPSSIKTKIFRAAFDEWIQNHENDFNIDWEQD